MLDHSSNSENKQVTFPELNISDIILFSKSAFPKMFFISLFFGLIGYGVSFLLPVSFSSSLTLLPESASSAIGMGSLSSLARLGGLGKNESGGAIQPELYPTLLETYPFALQLLKQPIIDVQGHRHKTLLDFLNKNTEAEDDIKNIKVPPYQKSLTPNILLLSKLEDIKVRKALSLVKTNYDIKAGTLTISSETSDPVVAAQIVELASNYLIEYVTNYRSAKSQREVTFLEKRVDEAKIREQNAEYALQSYRDRNRNFFLNVARIEEQRLQAEYLLAQNLYADIVRKWEDAKIKVKEDQVVIKVLEPARVPFKKSKPNRKLVSLVAALFGFSLTIIWLFWKYKYPKLHQYDNFA